ncbi:MAG: S24 family peptidase [Bdellovibrionota bacterium]
MDHPLDWNEFLIKHPAASFTVRVMGDSMSPLIPDGALVIVDKSLTPKNGDVVVAVYNGEFTLKQYAHNRQANYLIPYNSKFPTITVKQGR